MGPNRSGFPWQIERSMMENLPEVFREIPGFPGYAVSSLGRIQNTNTGRDMRIGRNGRGISMVGMMFAGVQYKRSVALLVAQAFLDLPPHESFDSVIHLNGDKTHCAASNLMWRPLWFAGRYHQQFGRVESLRFLTPVHCIETDEWFENSEHMAKTYGLLERDIVRSFIDGDMIWPTRYTIEVADL